MSGFQISRRAFLASSLAGPGPVRRFHLSISEDALDADPDLLGLVRLAGVTDVWITGFLYGHWYYTPERIERTLKRVTQAGLAAHVCSVPLGHPGDSLGAVAGQPPLIPPPHWKQGVRLDGKLHWGNSLHAPATDENAAALRRLATLGVKRVMLDDDFRLAPGPGQIGGCACDEHMAEFRRLHGYAASIKEQLADAARRRELTPELRAWVDYQCDQLSACFHQMRRAAPALDLGVMVMWMGAEKAGIRLADYRDVPFRVGELMFNDRSFSPVKGKTDELFSALFHRRFARPELAFSETTAFPADKLSASNMAAKLAVSTLADVRNTMFMSGLAAFPRTHWDVLAPAMRRQAAIHARVAGHTPRGPFKHFWGERGRYVSDDRPDSLFLAAGVPFEVVDTPPRDGFVFGESEPATLEELYALKRRLAPQLADIPYIEDDKPVVCSWLPTARTVLLWNLSEGPETFTLRHGADQRRVTVAGLDLAEVRL
jgi:hypothetical protein